jgi:general secretion pathway protein K
MPASTAPGGHKMRALGFLSHQEPSEGFILIAVLWILAALAALAAIYSFSVNETASVLVSHDEKLQAQELALAGVELAVYELTATPKAQPSRGKLGFRLGNAAVTVDFRSESARIDLNLAPKPVLAGLFTVLGVKNEDAEGFADRILAWRTPRTSGASDSEAALYRSAGRSYGPRHGPFQHVNELGLVSGLPPALIDCAMPYLTVFSGQAGIDILGAAPEVLSALPGITPERLEILLSQRQGASQDVLKAQLGMAAQYITVQPSKANRITVAVRLDTNRQVRSQAVVLLPDKDTEPFRMMSWREDIGEPEAPKSSDPAELACARGRVHANVDRMIRKFSALPILSAS